MSKYLKKMSVVPKTSKIHNRAVVVGDVILGQYCTVYHNAIIRGDSCSITIGDNTNIQDNCVVHGDEGFNVTVGENCIIAHSVILHGCTVGNNTCIGMGSIILNGAKVGNNCMVGAGSVVSGKTIVPDGYLAVGNPAVVKRPLTEEEIKRNKGLVEHYKGLLDNFYLYNVSR